MRTHNKNTTLLALACAAMLVTAHCASPNQAGGIIVTIHPLALIVQEIVGSGLGVTELVRPGASSHTYEPSARDAKNAAFARALFYVDDAVDGWAAKLSSGQHIRVLEFVPPDQRPQSSGDAEPHGREKHLGDINGHFWTSPAAVKSIVPALTEKLSTADPAHAEAFRNNAARFASELESLDREIAAMLQPHAGKSVTEFHPSWDYFLARYGIHAIGYLEPAPGKELSVKAMEGLIARSKAAKVKIVFSEPQLAPEPARVLAEAIGAKVLEMDALAGGAKGGYCAWLRTQAQTLANAL